MKTMSKEEALAIVRKDDRNEPPTLPGEKPLGTEDVLELCRKEGIKIEVRDADGRPEIFAEKGRLPAGARLVCRTHRDALIRGIWMRDALKYLAGRGVLYMPLDVEEDINVSCHEDDLDTFRQNLRGWVKELARAA